MKKFRIISMQNTFNEGLITYKFLFENNTEYYPAVKFT